MKVSITELRSNIYRCFEKVRTTGIPLEIIDKHGQYTMKYNQPKSRLQALQEDGLDILACDLEEIIEVKWPNPSQEENNLS